MKDIVVLKKFIVKNSSKLLEFLFQNIKDSKNNIKSILKKRSVLVNKSVVTKFDFMLLKDDIVEILKKGVSETFNKDKKFEKNSHKNDNNKKYLVIYEDKYYLAIEKKEGILSTYSDDININNCYNIVINDYLEKYNKRLFLLHRLDKDTSGVLLFCKDVSLSTILKLRWNEFIKKRDYVCVCMGIFSKKEGVVKTYLDYSSNTKVFVTKDATKKEAITKYKVIKEKNNLSLLSVSIFSGRKNQIRVHMNHIGHEILGDTKYGSSKTKSNRLFLHANLLSFFCPYQKKVITIESKIPSTFYKFF